jgi:quercetin dioxygenase-like cupin family protein
VSELGRSDFGTFDGIGPQTPYTGIARRVLTTSKATVQEYRFEPGATYPLHRHPQEQITLVLDGDLVFSADGEARELSAGAWSVVPGEVPHGITAGPAGTRFLAILVPPRKEPHP